MPPKRKRTEETTATRTTRSTTRNKSKNGTDNTPSPNETCSVVTDEDPPIKKPRKTSAKKTKASTSTSKANAKADVDYTGSHSAGGSILDDHEASVLGTNDDKPVVPAAVTKPKPAKRKVPDPEPYSAARAEALFEQYADGDNASFIGPEGFERLCNDAEIPLEGALPLVLAWQVGASEMAKILKSEWDKATSELQIASLSALSIALCDLEGLLLLNKSPIKPVKDVPNQKMVEPYDRSRYYNYAANKKKAIRELYLFCFMLAKPPQTRNIDMETASAFWSVLVVPQYPIMQDILDFINEKGTYRGVNKDLWLMVFEFCQTVSPTLEDYEADGAWPTMLDDFVAWKKGKTPQTAPESETNGESA